MLNIGMGEALIIGMICCVIGGGAALAVGLLVFAMRKKREPE